MRRARWMLLLAVSVAAAAEATDGAVSIERPGRLIDALVLDEGPHAGCALLLEAAVPAAYDATSLSMLCIEGGRPVEVLRSSAPLRAHALHLDSTDETSTTVLVGRVGGLVRARIDAAGVVSSSEILRDERIGPIRLGERPDLDGDGTRDLVLASYDGVLSWTSAEDGGFELHSRAPLPRVAQLFGERFDVSGPEIAGGPETPHVYTVPRRALERRLRVHRVPTASPGDSACAVWVATEEELTALGAVVQPGDPPRMYAIARPAESVSLRGDVLLLSFPLRCNTPGAPIEPDLERRTPLTILGPVVHFERADLSGDGTDDLLLAGYSGLLDREVEIVVYVTKDDGELPRRPWTWTIDTGDGGCGSYSYREDLDGDGLRDLVCAQDGLVSITFGETPRRPDVPLAREPERELETDGGVRFARGEKVIRLGSAGERFVLIPLERRVESGGAVHALRAWPLSAFREDPSE